MHKKRTRVKFISPLLSITYSTRGSAPLRGPPARPPRWGPTRISKSTLWKKVLFLAKYSMCTQNVSTFRRKVLFKLTKHFAS